MAPLLDGVSPGPWASLIALAQVSLIDLALASDNAVAVGMAAAALPQPQRRNAIALGLAIAVALLCGLAFFAVRLLEAGGGGLVMGGGLLLLLISRQMWSDLRRRAPSAAPRLKDRTLLQALAMILAADVSTSLDNVLAIAGVARDQPTWVLLAGLGLSVALTGLAAAQVARLIRKWPWIGYLGLALVVVVALRMIWDGATALGWLKA